ncbi:hypothetical protein FDP41_006675 [Naegleria fowleri]|uniref:Uncharacterized protein n=1 Tax=Naegleria fowleri TaxID=5763 RepID=A0A6A5BKB1_NAEFO|nr:uncharacterized protein FDP41_006675 [Naegleria fowleri]KAF0974065.1 hypothetical protein FDP41_006675 [Naegleria fowleri]
MLKCKVPLDVNISYQHDCILVSDVMKKSIEIYDLQYRSFVKSLKFVNKDVYAWHICVEHQRFEKDSLIVVCSDCSVHKFDLKQLIMLETNDDMQSMLSSGLEKWKLLYFKPCGIDSDSTFKYESIEKQCIYIGDRGTGIRVVNSLKGNILQTISISSFVKSVKVIANDELLVSEFHPNLSVATSKLLVLKNNQDEWMLERTIGTQGTGEQEIYFPHDFDFDHVSQNIIVSDTCNLRIQLFDYRTGRHVGCFKDVVEGYTHC